MCWPECDNFKFLLIKIKINKSKNARNSLKFRTTSSRKLYRSKFKITYKLVRRHRTTITIDEFNSIDLEIIIRSAKQILSLLLNIIERNQPLLSFKINNNDRIDKRTHKKERNYIQWENVVRQVKELIIY